MRKTYKKPVFMVETFTLTQSIAVNCGSSYAGPDGVSMVGKPLLHDISSCAFDYGNEGDMILFLDSNEACDNIDHSISIGSLDDFNEFIGENYCYQAPSEDTSVFDS